MNFPVSIRFRRGIHFYICFYLNLWCKKLCWDRTLSQILCAQIIIILKTRSCIFPGVKESALFKTDIKWKRYILLWSVYGSNPIILSEICLVNSNLWRLHCITKRSKLLWRRLLLFRAAREKVTLFRSFFCEHIDNITGPCHVIPLLHRSPKSVFSQFLIYYLRKRLCSIDDSCLIFLKYNVWVQNLPIKPKRKLILIW
jgi:hypothetical protein